MILNREKEPQAPGENLPPKTFLGRFSAIFGRGGAPEPKSVEPEAPKSNVRVIDPSIETLDVDEALNAETALKRFEADSGLSSVTFRFELEPATKGVEKARYGFTVRYPRPSDDNAHGRMAVKIISIDDGSAHIEYDILPKDREMHIHSSVMASLSGKKVYSALLKKITQNTDTVSRSVTNKATSDLRLQYKSKGLPHSVLRTESPLAGGLGDGFISTLDRTGTEMTSWRVDAKLEKMLSLASKLRTSKKVQKHEVAVTRKLVADLKEYVPQNELPAGAMEAIEVQIEFLEDMISHLG